VFLGFGSKGHHFNTPYLALFSCTHSIQLSKNKNRPEPHTLQGKLRACQGAFRSARESNRGSSREVSLYSPGSGLVKRRVKRFKSFFDASRIPFHTAGWLTMESFVSGIKPAIQTMCNSDVPHKTSAMAARSPLCSLARSSYAGI
jgi:hypothetical protein